MTGFRQRLFVIVASFSMLFGLIGAAGAQGQKNTRQIRDLVRTLGSQIDDLHMTLANELRSDPFDKVLQDTADRLRDLQDKVNSFDLNLTDHRENIDDVNDIIDATRVCDRPLTKSQPNQRISTEWNDIKATVVRLSAYYGVTPAFAAGLAKSASPYTSSDPVPTSTPTRTSGGPPVLQRQASASDVSSDLTGTYKLDTSRSENTDQILASLTVSAAQKQDLQQKLEAPGQLAIDVRGSQVTIASSIATPITFTADGSEKAETDASGASVRVHATLKGQELTLSSIGGENDYTIIFTPIDGGHSLKVTRRITTDYLSETVFEDSVYEKTDNVAGLGINSGGSSSSDQNTAGTVSSNDQNTAGTASSSDQNSSGGGWSSNDQNNSSSPAPTVAPARTGKYVVPNGTVIIANLESTVDTKVSQNNDRFTMTVQSPNEYRGAVIEGRLSNVGHSGRVSGDANVTFNFESITLADGTRYDFGGFLQSIRDQNGKTVKVDAEGTAHGNSQTKQTAKRGGVGAGLGALIGVIAGGGTGAAVGAIIGGGVGAGSVVVQGRDDIQLLKGSTITLQSSSPVHSDKPSE
jgi:hypothetical protein